ncbi:MAG TPA: FecR domain-containing protein [Polyangiaceae bacterium]|jgi:hypothetical protein
MTRGSGYFGVAALDALTREVARAPLPPVDWDRVEQGLLAAVSAAERHLPAVTKTVARPRFVASPMSIALAAAAAVAVVQAIPGDDGSLTPVEHRTVATSAPDPLAVAPVPVREDQPGSDRLQSGAVAETGADPLRYESRGAVTFTVAPASRVKMVSETTAAAASPSVTVALLEGSIHAEVIPHPEGEVFAVEVGKTRVAAHGTSFTVTRVGDRAIVEITHGSVAVGPAGHPGSTHGWLLVGPDKASFSLDGAIDATWLTAPTEVGSEPVAVSTAVASSPPIATAESEAERTSRTARRADPPRSRARVAKANNEPAVVDALDQQRAVSAILSRLGACYDRQVASFDVRFSIRSSLTLTIAPNGTVREGLFDPPLSPTLMECARDAIAATRFPQESSTTVVRVPVELQPSR